jgi:hypothetical protein
MVMSLLVTIIVYFCSFLSSFLGLVNHHCVGVCCCHGTGTLIGSGAAWLSYRQHSHTRATRRKLSTDIPIVAASSPSAPGPQQDYQVCIDCSNVFLLLFNPFISLVCMCNHRQCISTVVQLVHYHQVYRLLTSISSACTYI